MENIIRKIAIIAAVPRMDGTAAEQVVVSKIKQITNS